MTPLTTRESLSILALVSGTVVAFEVLLTRLLSVTTWYSLAFAVLSLAMLGLTSGSLSALRAAERAEPLRPWITSRLAQMSLGLLVATAITTGVPITFDPDLTSFASLLLVALSATLPLIAGGAVVARLMSGSTLSISSLYAVDLAGAAAGALLPLALLGPCSAPSAIVLLAAGLALAGLAITPRPAGKLVVVVPGVAVAVLLLSQFTSGGLTVKFPKGRPYQTGQRPIFEAWNPLSHVYLPPFTRTEVPFFWSPSPKKPHGEYWSAHARIDGAAGTSVPRHARLADLDFLRYDATTAAHALRPDGTACVIGVGGGRDLLAALLYGHEHVIGVEVNPALVEMLGSVGKDVPALWDPRVRIEIGDGRTFFAGFPGTCRVLQASLVDTWAATTAGAFAHTESTLYTREAWAAFLRRVAPDGIVTFSRWYNPSQVHETARLVSLAVAALLDRGVAQPRQHIALIGAGFVATILVSPAPLSARDLQALHALIQTYEYDLLLAPDQRPRDPLLDRLLDARTVDALAEAGASGHHDTSAADDDRPFFFHLASAGTWLHPMEIMRAVSQNEGVMAGNVIAMLQVLITILAITVIGAVLLGPTLVRAARAQVPLLPGGRAHLYFAGLGAGFMVAEIALVQRMHVVLGHPTYALIIVLAGLLVSTGIGSALSPRLLRTRRSVTVAALGAAALLLCLPYAVIRPLARATLASGFALRAGWAGGCAALLGLVLGMLFPSGLRYVSRERGAPAALALNGVASVLGSAAALLVSVHAGISASFTFAAVIYLAAALSGPSTWRLVDGAAGPVVDG